MAVTPKKQKLEDYRQGYPQLAAFLLLDDNFTIVRRFDYLHLRAILDQQDQLAELEESLNKCDDDEPIQLNLSSRRQNRNETRRAILNQIRDRLATYDQTVLQFQRMRGLPAASPANILSVQNWFDGTKPLVRSESACYLSENGLGDFVMAGPEDADRAIPESLLDLVIRAAPRLRDTLNSSQSKTNDSNIFLFSRKNLKLTITVFMTLAVPAWLLFHVALLSSLSQNASRVVAYAVFLIATSFVVMMTTNASKYNLILALLTYAAVPTSILIGPSG
ncbi:hypothetical protein F5X98DRAFT_42475 [Xylaria grammica]|nr:hypothetical protein F5X98DRAFT_42475 [Xylaria grammica]